MRLLAALLAILIATQAYAAGVAYTGVSFKQDVTPDYILIVGDPQIGAQCVSTSLNRWSGAWNDAAHQACGDAQVTETDWVIREAFSKYPIDYAVIEGDLIDTSGQWQVDAAAAMIDALPASIRSKLNWVGGNHDSDSTTCNRQWRYHSTEFETGEGVAPLYWEKTLRHTRLFGIQSSLITMDASTACHAQNDSAKYVAASPGGDGYADSVCFGVDPGGGGTANGFACTINGDCNSGQCGVWEDFYSGQMDFIATQFQKFNDTRREETLIMNMHQALCRDVGTTSSCANTETTTSHVFDRMQNLKTCDSGADVGKYCDINNGAHACDGGAACTTARSGFDTRTTVIAHAEAVNPVKQGFVVGSGHVGSSAQEPTVATNQFTSGTPFLKAEVVGAYTMGWTDLNYWALVVKVEHNKAPTIVEYLRGTNNSPVLDEIGTAGVISMGGTDTFTFTATDPDYGNLDWRLTTAIDGCFTFDAKNQAAAGDIDADLDSAGCSGSYGPYTVCVSDGLMSVGVPTGDGIEVCSNFTVQAS